MQSRASLSIQLKKMTGSKSLNKVRCNIDTGSSIHLGVNSIQQSLTTQNKIRESSYINSKKDSIVNKMKFPLHTRNQSKDWLMPCSVKLYKNVNN